MNSLKNHRKKMGLSRLEVAEKLHIHEETLARYERGTREPVGSLLREMALLFGCSVDELLNPTAPLASPGDATTRGARTA